MRKLTAAGQHWEQAKHEYQEALDEIVRVGAQFGVTEAEAEAVLDEIVQAFTEEEQRKPTTAEMVQGLRTAVREALGADVARQMFGHQ